MDCTDPAPVDVADKPMDLTDERATYDNQANDLCEEDLYQEDCYEDDVYEKLKDNGDAAVDVAFDRLIHNNCRTDTEKENARVVLMSITFHIEARFHLSICIECSKSYSAQHVYDHFIPCYRPLQMLQPKPANHLEMLQAKNGRDSALLHGMAGICTASQQVYSWLLFVYIINKSNKIQ